MRKRRNSRWLRVGTLFCGLLFFGAVGQVSALTLNLIEGTDDAVAELSGALLAPTSGIAIVAGSEDFVGAVGNGTDPNTAQSATYTDLNLVNNNTGPTISNPDGILLTSGTANVPFSNTNSSFDPFGPSTGSDADLSAILSAAGMNSTTNDVNYFSFGFIVDAGINSISADFVFGSDEFPNQGVTDIFAFFVDGVNYAFFPDGSLASFDLGANADQFVNNDIGTGNYNLEYDGLSLGLHVTGLLDMSLDEHVLKIAIADTSDTIFDSGVFIGNLFAGTSTGGGGIGDDGPAPVPEPSTIVLMGAGLLGLVFTRKRMKK